MTGVPPPRQGVSFRVNVEDVRAVVKEAPRVAYFWLRGYLFEAAKTHRQQWLRAKGTRFGRVSDGGRGILVSRVNEGNVPPRDNEVAYQVTPREQRQPSREAASRAIGELRADIFTGNKILPVHEFGTDITSQGWMAVPVRTRPANIRRWRERNPGKTLITLPSKKDPSTRVVYEVQLRRMRGRVARDFVGPAPMREKLRLRFVLTKRVEMDPTLRLYESWDNMQSAQDEVFQRYADRMIRDLERGIAS